MKNEEKDMMEFLSGNFCAVFNEVAEVVHQNAIKKGWWEKDRNDGEIIALCHSELSEMLEGLRHGNPKSDKIPNFLSSEEEAADVVIRLMDYCEKRDWDLAGAIMDKIAYNRERPHRHGGKKF